MRIDLLIVVGIYEFLGVQVENLVLYERELVLWVWMAVLWL